MSTPEFSPSWLSLREPFDHRARSARLTERLATALDGLSRPRIIDLGCGHGSNMRYLAPRLPPEQRWTLMDHDPRLLAWIADRPAPEGASVRLQQQDLSAGIEGLALAADAVVTSALLDLVSADWLAQLARTCARHRWPFLAALTVDGRVTFAPGDPRDADIMRWFRAHQRTDRGFGPSPGYLAADQTAALLESAGMAVYTEQTDWRIAPSDQAMMAEMVRGIAHAAAECSPRPDTVRRWEADRLTAISQAALGMVVGHVDVLALPL